MFLRPSVGRRVVVVLVGILLAFTATAANIGQVQAAHALPASYSCYSTKCYAEILWGGSVLGGKTKLTVAGLQCGSSCTTSNKWHISDEIWLNDTSNWAITNCPLNECWVEVGTGSDAFASLPAPNGCSDGMCYIWGDSRPCGGGIILHYGKNASYDVGTLSSLTIQRSANNGYHTCRPNTTWSVTATSGYWGTGASGTSTYNPIYPDQIQIGLEVYGSRGQYAPRADWTYNQWVNTGNWAYQRTNADTCAPNPPQKCIDPPTQGDWAVRPGDSTTGGNFWGRCGSSGSC